MQEKFPQVGEFTINVGTPNWRDSAIAALKARKRAGATIGEIVESVFGEISDKNSVHKNARAKFELIIPDLVDLGVVVKKGVRYHWWRYAK